MSGASPSASTISNARGLLALDAVGVDRVHQLDRVRLGELAGGDQAVVEVAVDLQQRGAVRDRLAQLAHRDLAVRHQHRADHAGARGVGRGRRRRVAGRRADDGLGAAAGRRGHRGRHAAVLERPGRVHALDLDEHLGARALRERRRRDERRAALAERDDALLDVGGQAVGVLGDDAAPLVGHQAPSTRRTDTTRRTTSRPAMASTVLRSACSGAACVVMTRRATSASGASVDRRLAHGLDRHVVRRQDRGHLREDARAVRDLEPHLVAGARGGGGQHGQLGVAGLDRALGRRARGAGPRRRRRRARPTPSARPPAPRP